MESVGVTLEVPNYPRVQQRNSVRGDGIGESRTEFLRHRRASDDVTLFQHDDTKTGHGQIGRANKSVVPAADDDYIVHPINSWADNILSQ